MLGLIMLPDGAPRQRRGRKWHDIVFCILAAGAVLRMLWRLFS